MDEETRNYLYSISATITPCGSRVTCCPPPTDTDADFLVEVFPFEIAGVMTRLYELGYSWEGSREHYQNQIEDGFSSFRKNDVNLIVTSNTEFAKRHRAATYVCKRLNLMVKDDRISLFQAVLYGEQWSGRK